MTITKALNLARARGDRIFLNFPIGLWGFAVSWGSSLPVDIGLTSRIDQHRLLLVMERLENLGLAQRIVGPRQDGSWFYYEILPRKK